MSGTCNAHGKFEKALDSIVDTVHRLEGAQARTAEVQAEMSQTLAVVANTLESMEGTNVIIERLAGKIDLVFDQIRKDEKEKDEIYLRLRALEEVSAHPRLKKLEESQGACSMVKEIKGRQDKTLWGGLTVVAMALIGTVIKLAWK